MVRNFFALSIPTLLFPVDAALHVNLDTSRKEVMMEDKVLPFGSNPLPTSKFVSLVWLAQALFGRA